ncbi:hypothetical protein C1645_773475 [Glomus cerebriforme]|uniref:RRM domain-containing protein n=1 Tax=Glomus cerebriforme TaxID=658196 RepID=A0A397SYF6_9GLOM|nr:hypothetical protein C1645_773475 [Glomus cerebriforme]
MNTLSLEEQFLTLKKINRDQSRIIDSKQQIIEDQARLINSQQQLIDMMYENIKVLKNEINKLQNETEEEGSSSQYRHLNSHQNHRQTSVYGSSNGGEHSNENLTSNDFEHEKYGNNGYNGYRVFLKNLKSSISSKALKMQLERNFGPINDITHDNKKQCAYAYFKNRQDSTKALNARSITIDNIFIEISSGK